MSDLSAEVERLTLKLRDLARVRAEELEEHHRLISEYYANGRRDMRTIVDEIIIEEIGERDATSSVVTVLDAVLRRVRDCE